jgi:histidinol-phosphatase (PHP family)
MSWPRIDLHTHICRTSLETMLASAEERGLREFGISEHIFQLDEGNIIFPHSELEGACIGGEWYVNAVRSARDERQVKVLLGLEVDFLPGTEGEVGALLSETDWDYLIGSVHEIGNWDLFTQTPSDADEGVRLWDRYFSLMAEATESGLFDIISHPVRNALLNPHLPEDFDEQLASVASVAARNDVALELNGEDITRWPELVERLVAACVRTNCLVSLGSDAHGPETVTRGLQRAAEMAAAAGVRGCVTYEDRERRIVSLD